MSSEDQPASRSTTNNSSPSYSDFVSVRRKFDEREYVARTEARIRLIVTISALLMGFLMVCGAFFLAFARPDDKSISTIFAVLGTFLVIIQFSSSMSRSIVSSSRPIASKKSSVSAYFNEFDKSE